MTELEKQAIKYGIPMPETCKELDWKKQTLFYWARDTKLDLDWIIVPFELYCTETNKNLSARYDIIPAPQMHEIAMELPKTIYYKETTFYLDLIILDSFEQYLKYNDEYYKKSVFEIEIKIFHYADAYAQMFLKLKELNLL